MSDTIKPGTPNPTDNAGGSVPTTDPAGNQAGNSEQTVTTPQQPGESDIDYKKRYADSTREYQNLKSERDKETPYVKLGQAFATRYQSDPEFKEFVDKKYGEQPSSNSGGESKGAQVPTPPSPTETWATNKMVEEQTHKVNIFAKLEEGHTETIDKYNQPTANGTIFNPVRNAIGTLTQAYERDGMPFEKAATLAFSRILNPEKALNDAEIDGMVEGLTSASLAYVGGGAARSKAAGDASEPTTEDIAILSKLGIDPKSNVFKDVVSGKL